MPSASSASSADKSIAVLIKKAMAKMPMSLDNKKSVDEYYKNAMKEIVLKIKATEKAKKDALKAKEKVAKVAKAAKAKKVEKVAKKPTVSIPKSKEKIAKKRRGGYVDNDTENNLIIDIVSPNFIFSSKSKLIS
jgi:DsbC/DsbD-like thiol-disulfide interchange protein